MEAYSDSDEKFMTLVLAGLYRKYGMKQPNNQIRETKLNGSRQLEDWLMNNLDNPYPSKPLIKYFVKSTGLTYKQINNWFGNARSRWPELKGEKGGTRRKRDNASEKEGSAKKKRKDPFHDMFVYA